MLALRILIIDDSKIVRTLLENELTTYGHKVILSDTPVGNARHLPNVDLVIIDFHMPGMNGDQVISSLRSARGNKETPLFYLYTSDLQIAYNALTYGFDGYITDKGNMLSTIKQINAISKMVNKTNVNNSKTY